MDASSLAIDLPLSDGSASESDLASKNRVRAITKVLRRVFKRRIAVPYACFKLFTSRRSLIRQFGWIGSMGNGCPLDAAGNPVPWMNYSVVEFLEQRLVDSHRVFEFGSGYSTCFYARRCHEVISVEYDRDWHAMVTKMIPTNAQVLYRATDEDGDYCRSICEIGQTFDVVIVDGDDRNHCVDQAINRLSADGVIVLDDSDREDYRPSFDRLASLGFKELTISGLKPGSPCRHQTTIFYRSDNCFRL